MMDYWFDLKESGGVKSCIAYAVNGFEVTRVDNSADTSRSYTDLMTDCMPAIQEDIEMYGVAA